MIDSIDKFQFCPFCDKVIDGTALYFEEHKGVYHFEPIDPVVEGHRLFIPGVHVEKGGRNLHVHLASAMAAATKYGESQEDDYNLIISLGDDATQTIDHIHVHYVPRRPQDGLRLPWTSH